MGKVILFYKYTSIEYPKRILKWQRQICTDLQLKGRILIAHEGINGTLGGEIADVDRYVEIMRKHEQFADIDFKESEGSADYFPRMEIKVKKEAVNLGLDIQEINVNQTGRHLTPSQVHELLSEKPADLVVLDARNDYEWRIGAIEGALKPEISNFRDLPAYIDKHLEDFKDKQVLMYCTGGIRCERATAYLNMKGVAKDVMQIDGGIVRYVEQYPDGFFRGKNYVFDRRVAIPVNHDVLSVCDLCKKPCDEYTNCINARCNNHYIGCSDCLVAYDSTCSIECKDMIAAGAKKREPFIKVPTACLLKPAPGDTK